MTSMIQRHIDALKKLKGRSVEAGWFASARYGSGAGGSPGQSVASVARIQEFGATIRKTSSKGTSYTVIIPARPFMRLAWKNFQNDRVKIQDKIAKDLISGKINADQALGQIGTALENSIVRSIRNGGWQANSPHTIRAKGFDKPLIDTAHMWQSVSSIIT